MLRAHRHQPSRRQHHRERKVPGEDAAITRGLVEQQQKHQHEQVELHLDFVFVVARPLAGAVLQL